MWDTVFIVFTCDEMGYTLKLVKEIRNNFMKYYNKHWVLNLGAGVHSILQACLRSCFRSVWEGKFKQVNKWRNLVVVTGIVITVHYKHNNLSKRVSVTMEITMSIDSERIISVLILSQGKVKECVTNTLAVRQCINHVTLGKWWWLIYDSIPMLFRQLITVDLKSIRGCVNLLIRQKWNWCRLW